ncbi:XdhC family protein [Streptomyces sp.]|uniref:XdhC family protein n=1 Tax=Streptomyces sp. TaxID=1931 RepID=UPI002D7A0D4C|nr:XdhC family protein [Streptomyces sp.]HET6356590.1 XdhC family protein [Streptomyces sp.]
MLADRPTADRAQPPDPCGRRRVTPPTTRRRPAHAVVPRRLTRRPAHAEHRGQLYDWSRRARPFALATVIQVSGSAPLPSGTALAVDAGGQMVGSISCGCVEGVYDLRQQLLADGGAPARACFGYSDDDAFAVGLT